MTKQQSEVVSSAIRKVLAARRRLSPLAHEIGSMIVTGELPEGQSLSERMFGTARGISRTSFREAIKVLEGKGLVQARQNSGTSVAPREKWHQLDPELLAWRISGGGIERFIRDFFVFRRCIEPPAAEAAAANRDTAAIAVIRRAFTAMKELEAKDPFGEDFVEADLRFHQSILLASGNEFLVAMGQIVGVPLMLSFTLHSKLEVGPSNRLMLHERVVMEIEGGNAAAAYAASLALLSDVERDVQRMVGHVSVPESAASA